jgi:alpha-L-fucosidase
LIRTVIDCVSKGGNLLLNVGPTARGEFDERAMDRLQGIGEWMKRHSRSIYGCTQAPEEFVCPKNCSLTYNPEKKRLYVHVLAWPYKHLHLIGKAYVERVEYAQLLNDASEIRTGLDSWHATQIGEASDTPVLNPTETADAEGRKGQIGSTHYALVLNLPAQKPNVAVPVIELFLKQASGGAGRRISI